MTFLPMAILPMVVLPMAFYLHPYIDTNKNIECPQISEGFKVKCFPDIRVAEI